MTLRILVVCEAPADFRTASELADRVLCERIAWLDEALLPSVRQWWELDPDHSFLRWDALDKVAETHGYRRLRARSRFGGEPGAADAAAADRALQLAAFMGRSEGLVGVMLIRDSDGDGERRRGLEQARILDEGRTWPFRVVVGVAEPKREAWVLAGFEPQDAAEQRRLGDLRRELGRDPCVHSHEFDARTPRSKKELKGILERLTGGDLAREATCWQDTPLDHLKQRGQHNGLAAYLAEIDEHIVPLLTPR